MPNNFFRFKQFVVKQNKSAMKVCTDACLFGAWAASIIQNSKYKIQSIVDVGTGTGLLSLILAQKIDTAIFDAVEIDKAAAGQAKDNFQSSIWKERMCIHHSSIQQFASSPVCKYDCMISNPPFYAS